MMETKNTIASLMDELGLEFEYEFVPFSKSRNAKPRKDGEVWRSLNWFVALKKSGRVVARFDYSAGEGHTPAFKSGGKLTIHKQKMIEFEIEKGYAAKVLWGDEFEAIRSKPILPDPENVLYSLVLDSSVLDYACFEDWAAEYGYSDDSREAEKAYQECLKHALALRVAIGDGNLERLKEAFQDW